MSWCCFRRVDSSYDLPPVPPVIQNEGDLDTVFEKILRDPKQKKQLLEFCKRTHCTESFAFISDFMKWKENQTKPGSSQLLNEFIDPTAARAINVSKDHSERISDLLEDYDKNKELIFQELQKCFKTSALDLLQNYNNNNS